MLKAEQPLPVALKGMCVANDNQTHRLCLRQNHYVSIGTLCPDRDARISNAPIML